MNKRNLLTGFIGLLCSHLAFNQQGCMDITATNFNPSATVEDFSCTYTPITLEIPANQQIHLPNYLKETSGLAIYNNLHWTHNDDGSSKIYGFDPELGVIADSIDIGVQVQDWEDLQFHNGKFYIGDFGNNVNGARSNLRIFRFDVSTMQVDTIRFNYVNQSILTPVAGNTTNFDCEAFLVTDDKVYLFTKQWTTYRTELHTLVNQQGDQVTTLVGDFNCEGLITGATFGVNEVILVGYTQLLAPFVYRITGYENDQFLTSNKRKYMLNLGLHQVEAVAFDSQRELLAISNETFSAFGQTVPAKWMYFGWDELLQLSVVSEEGMHIDNNDFLNGNPLYKVGTLLMSKADLGQIQIVNLMGQEVYKGILPVDGLNLNQLPEGHYFVHSLDNVSKYRIQINP